MYQKIFSYLHKPEIYQDSTANFWKDDYISIRLLEAHLNPDGDAATRNNTFVDTSVDWIASIAPPKQFPKLLDIGCGPGIYAEKFYQKSYCVTGVDFSKRSIAYAKSCAAKKNASISYQIKDYLKMTFENEFDLITLIYCDFGVLSPHDRHLLLTNIYAALKPNGRFIFDVFTPKFHAGKPESNAWKYCPTGFWKEGPHLCLDSFYRYDECATVLNQTIVITEETVDCYNIWEHTFTTAEIIKELASAGFLVDNFYGDVSGAALLPDCETICTVAKKKLI